MTIRAVVFDFGGVLFDWSPQHLYRQLIADDDERQWFLDNICTKDWNLEFDAGERYSEGVAKLITRYPRYWREIQAFDTRWKWFDKSRRAGLLTTNGDWVSD